MYVRTHLDLPVGQLESLGQELLEDYLGVSVCPRLEQPDRRSRRVERPRRGGRVHRRRLAVVLPERLRSHRACITDNIGFRGWWLNSEQQQRLCIRTEVNHNAERHNSGTRRAGMSLSNSEIDENNRWGSMEPLSRGLNIGTALRAPCQLHPLSNRIICDKNLEISQPFFYPTGLFGRTSLHGICFRGIVYSRRCTVRYQFGAQTMCVCVSSH